MRNIETIIAGMLLFSMAPIFFVLGVAVKLSSAGPVFYRQARVGKNGSVFKMYKFRSMRIGSDKLGYRTQKNDTRVTWVGKILRLSSLDELPQIYNIYRGEMSFLGPRPDVPAQLQDYDKDSLAKRLSVSPGVTGLSQSLIRSNGTFSTRLKGDLYYVDNRSFRMHFKIIIKTILTVINSSRSN